MTKIIDVNTRFYIDIDIKDMKIISWDYGQRQELARELADPDHRRIFITKGQYRKLGKTIL